MTPEPLPNADAGPDPLEARLRALPAPEVPATLEARLLAAIPTARPPNPGRRLARACLVGAVAAACLLVLAAWRWTSRPSLPPRPPKAAPYVKSPRPAEDIARMTAWQAARSIQEETTLTTFVWPLPDTKPVLAWNSLRANDSD